MNHLTNYIELAAGAISISPADFGIAALRKGIIAKDAESVVKNLHTVNLNIAKYEDTLTLQSFRDELGAKFTSAVISVAADKQKQYEITSNRKNLVQNNVASLNDLFKQFNEILKVGKILYKGVAKLKDYTFSELKKNVRKTGKNGKDTQPTAPDDTKMAPNSCIKFTYI